MRYSGQLMVGHSERFVKSVHAIFGERSLAMSSYQDHVRGIVTDLEKGNKAGNKLVYDHSTGKITKTGQSDDPDRSTRYTSDDFRHG